MHSASDIEELQKRVSTLEKAMARLTTTTGQEAPTPSTPAKDDPLWALNGVEERAPDGAVLYTGTLRLPSGDLARWQYAQPADKLLDEDWSEQATALASLGHPVRLRILHAVLHGATSVAELVEELEAGTSGQVYHHLKELTSAGWLISPRRGTFAVPGARIVPLLTILLAAGTPQ